MCRYPQRPTEDIRSSFRNEVTGDCELADMGAGNPGCLQEQHAPGTSESSPPVSQLESDLPRHIEIWRRVSKGPHVEEWLPDCDTTGAWR